MNEVKYPNIKVKLIGKDGNAFSIIGRVAEAMRKKKIPEEEIASFRKEAMRGDYNNLLRTCMKWVTVS
jgi:hypothetical protein